MRVTPSNCKKSPPQKKHYHNHSHDAIVFDSNRTAHTKKTRALFLQAPTLACSQSPSTQNISQMPRTLMIRAASLRPRVRA